MNSRPSDQGMKHSIMTEDKCVHEKWGDTDLAAVSKFNLSF